MYYVFIDDFIFQTRFETIESAQNFVDSIWLDSSYIVRILKEKK